MPRISIKDFMVSDPNIRKTIFERVIIFILLVAGVFLGGHYYVKNEKKSIFDEKERHLAVIAELKVNQITNWRYERLADARQLLPELSNPAKINRLRNIEDKEARKQLFYGWVKEFFYNSECEGIYLYTKGLNEITFVNSSGQSAPLDAYETSQANLAFKLKNIVMSDLYKNGFNNSVNIGIAAPIYENSVTGENTIGLLIIKLDPNKFLFPYIQSWPGSNKTFETLLVRKEGDRALFLNKLRFRDDKPLSFSIALTDEKVAAVMAIKGFEGVAEAMDYRDIPVLAAAKNVPDTDWKLIAKVDSEEIYLPVRSREVFAGLFISGFIIGIIALLGFIWYMEIADFYRKQYDAEVERKIVAKRCDYLIKYANVIIINFNKGLQIVEANDKAVSTYQYNTDEILKLNMRDLQAPETLQQFLNELKIVQDKGSYIFTTVNKRKDGSTFPAEMILQHFVIEWVDFYQAIVRDLSTPK